MQVRIDSATTRHPLTKQVDRKPLQTELRVRGVRYGKTKTYQEENDSSPTLGIVPVN
jgi:hypothetical protein